MILFMLAISIHTIAESKVTSTITNNTEFEYHVYWTAAGCIGLRDKVTELCKQVIVYPHSTATYAFSNLKTNIQVKVQPACVTNYVKKGKDGSWEHGYWHDISCPSGNGDWIVKSDGTCMLKGKGKGHVRNVIINNFEGNAKYSINGVCHTYNP